MMMAVRGLGVTFCHLLPGPAPWNLLPKLSGRRLPGRRSRQKVQWKCVCYLLWFGSSNYYNVSVFIIGLASSQSTNCHPCDLPHMIVDRGTSALKYRACAQNVAGAATVFSFWDAGLHQHEGSNALKHRACAQNVSDIFNSCYIYGCCPATRWGVECSQVPCLRTECVRSYF